MHPILTSITTDLNSSCVLILQKTGENLRRIALHTGVYLAFTQFERDSVLLLFYCHMALDCLFRVFVFQCCDPSVEIFAIVQFYLLEGQNLMKILYTTLVVLLNVTLTNRMTSRIVLSQQWSQRIVR